MGVVIIGLISGCTNSLGQSQSVSSDSADPSATLVSNDSSSSNVGAVEKPLTLWISPFVPAGIWPVGFLPKTTPDSPLSEEPGTYQERVRESDGAIEVLIPAGKFLMGCDQTRNGGFNCFQDELPLHKVYLSDYYIDKYEVTNRQYALCVEDGGCSDPYYKSSSTRDSYYGNPDYDDYPVMSLSWYEADTYCTWAGGRLPTEAEWEKAARGTTYQTYPWGDEETTCKLANSQDGNLGSPCIGDTLKVGSRPDGASPYGIMDMAGNVWEWVNDWYGRDYYYHSAYLNPQGYGTGLNKIVKGGSWDYSWGRLRIAYNSDHDPNTHNESFGFRCASSVMP
ncbi:MAG: formylglycine-generating enzyme family protein [Anaerolineaceae bacterium]